jgi:lipoprotein-anchoring transpeptidase ErfK/SrfK
MEPVIAVVARKRRRPIIRTLVAAALAVASYGAPASAYGWTSTDTTIAPGVAVGGVPVGGLDRKAAIAAVDVAYRNHILRVKVGKRTFSEWPRNLGQVIYSRRAVDVAWKVGRDGTTPPAATNIYLKVNVTGTKAAKWVAGIARVSNIRAINANYRLRKGRPKIFRDRTGRTLKQRSLVRIVRAALMHQARESSATAASLVAKTKIFDAVKPSLTLSELPKVVVVDKSALTLTLWSPRRKIRTYKVAVGQPKYPTAKGTYYIAQKQKNPTWTPPDSDWAKDAKPIPPGPDNPLGTRWMGLDHGGIGIHGTNNPSSIGSAVSHGCIRMRISDAEWLYDHVGIGTKVHVIA